MKKTLIFIVTIATVLSCSSDDCGECADFPQDFYFEIVDKASGENLFTNGTYDFSEIEIVNSLNSTPAQFQFIDIYGIYLIRIFGIGLETEIVNMQVSIAMDPIFDFYVDTERKKGECCYFNIYNEVEVRGAESEFISEIEGAYRILVD